MPTLEMFDMPARQRAKRRALMHAIDAGYAHGPMGHFVCDRCGHDADWLICDNETELRRGVPCPICNAKPNAQGERRTE